MRQSNGPYVPPRDSRRLRAALLHLISLAALALVAHPVTVSAQTPLLVHLSAPTHFDEDARTVISPG